MNVNSIGNKIIKIEQIFVDEMKMQLFQFLLSQFLFYTFIFVKRRAQHVSTDAIFEKKFY